MPHLPFKLDILSTNTPSRATSQRVALFFLSIFPTLLFSENEPFRLALRYQIKDAEDKGGQVTILEKSGIYLENDQVAKIGNQSRLEFLGPSGELLRVGHNTEFSPIAKNKLQFLRGSFLLYLHEGAPFYTIVIRGQEIRFAAHGTFLCELMPKGGLKVIALTGEGNIVSLPTGSTQLVRPSFVQFFLNDGENPPGVEIDVALLVNSCSLIVFFKDPLPSVDKIKELAIRQARTIKLRSNAYLYDAISKESIRLLVPKPAKNEKKPENRSRFSQWLKSKLPF
jgi:hypothetical protein